jgi:UDPglucose 6-dehydrogenase
LGDSIQFAENHYDALKDADALVICTEWQLFRNPDFDKVAQQLKSNTIFDGRNLYALDEMENQGFYYASIGRKTITQ